MLSCIIIIYTQEGKGVNWSEDGWYCFSGPSDSNTCYDKIDENFKQMECCFVEHVKDGQSTLKKCAYIYNELGRTQYINYQLSLGNDYEVRVSCKSDPPVLPELNPDDTNDTNDTNDIEDETMNEIELVNSNDTFSIIQIEKHLFFVLFILQML